MKAEDGGLEMVGKRMWAEEEVTEDELGGRRRDVAVVVVFEVLYARFQ